MAEIIKLLFVEDDADDIQIYQDTIRNLNEDYNGQLHIEATYENNKVDGLNRLRIMQNDLHGAFIDLKLTQGEQVEINEGNDVIKEIYEKLRFPIIVLTNTPGGFNQEFKQSAFLQLLVKTNVNYEEVIKSVIKIHQTGITKILGRRGLIETYLDNIFWKNISSCFDDWINVDNAEKSLLRFTLTHLQEYLEISDDGAGFEQFHAVENYIQPSIKSYFFTGDLIHDTSNINKRYLILTPACDLAPHKGIPKTKDVLIVEILPLEDSVLSQNISAAKKDPASFGKEIVESKENIKKIISNNFSPKYYYLPNTSKIKGGLINFQKLSTIKLKDLNLSYKKEATITTQFIKDIIAKFSLYYSRQGSPDFDFELLLQKHLI